MQEDCPTALQYKPQESKLSTLPYAQAMVEFIQAKSKEPITVLFALWAAESPPTVNELAAVTRIPRNGVTRALRTLDGYVVQEAGGRWPRWTLTPRARQMRLPGLLAEPATVRPGRQIAESDARWECINPVVVVDQNQPEQDINQQQQQQPARLMHAGSASRADLDEVLAALDQAGIAEPTRSRLAADSWVTADRIKRVAERARATGGKTGVIVTQLRAHVEPPDPIGAHAQRDDRSNVGYEWQAYLDARNGKHP